VLIRGGKVALQLLKENMAGVVQQQHRCRDSTTKATVWNQWWHGPGEVKAERQPFLEASAVRPGVVPEGCAEE
jgi:hypothetical protein